MTRPATSALWTTPKKTDRKLETGSGGVFNLKDKEEYRYHHHTRATARVDFALDLEKLGLLSEREQDRCRAILSGLDQEDAQGLADELSGALRVRGRGAPPRGIASPTGWLLRASMRTGEVLLYAEDEAERRADVLNHKPQPVLVEKKAAPLTAERKQINAALRASIMLKVGGKK